ncbi:endolytic peptidoglycan transglycosylase RlpA [Chimaeribacter californicus]|uniref:Endolytic peptidoglycan transglycosylase RlpA n=1 Tax=Chimaeribacter californicus TaxID=2060067 RepID=A0A2N5EA89_9GAMM|nr:endolytic peptidoglycan transglycosylase RlpA [Chimaeribacter californicus]PLR38781.1 endolytic peptidoglycan transglycosylase RlpA [Chimaeribacter californicus]
MRKQWLWVGIMGALLSACTTEAPQQQAPQQQPAYAGPVEEISGAEPHYEPYSATANQDYSVNGKTYAIERNPENFSQTGLASSYGAEANTNTTAIGEAFDPNALSAAHPTLPIPSYVRVTNLSNGRRIVVRINDRGPFQPGRIIDLSTAAAERLNISNNTKVKVDFINVAQDGTLSGPGTIGTTIAKQSYALPTRPDLGTSGLGTPVQGASAPVSAPVRAIDNSALSDGSMAEGTSSPGNARGGFLNAPAPVPQGILESDEPAIPAVAAVSAPAAAASAPTRTPATQGGYMVQVGALRDAARAQSFQQSLSQRFGVPGQVNAASGVYRVQLGPFSSRQQAGAIQQRLMSEAQQQSFITALPAGE